MYYAVGRSGKPLVQGGDDVAGQDEIGAIGPVPVEQHLLDGLPFNRARGRDDALAVLQLVACNFIECMYRMACTDDIREGPAKVAVVYAGSHRDF